MTGHTANIWCPKIFDIWVCVYLCVQLPMQTLYLRQDSYHVVKVLRVLFPAGVVGLWTHSAYVLWKDGTQEPAVLHHTSQVLDAAPIHTRLEGPAQGWANKLHKVMPDISLLQERLKGRRGGEGDGHLGGWLLREICQHHVGHPATVRPPLPVVAGGGWSRLRRLGSCSAVAPSTPTTTSTPSGALVSSLISLRCTRQTPAPSSRCMLCKITGSRGHPTTPTPPAASGVSFSPFSIPCSS